MDKIIGLGQVMGNNSEYLLNCLQCHPGMSDWADS